MSRGKLKLVKVNFEEPCCTAHTVQIAQVFFLELREEEQKKKMVESKGEVGIISKKEFQALGWRIISKLSGKMSHEDSFRKLLFSSYIA